MYVYVMWSWTRRSGFPGLAGTCDSLFPRVVWPACSSSFSCVRDEVSCFALSLTTCSLSLSVPCSFAAAVAAALLQRCTGQSGNKGVGKGQGETWATVHNTVWDHVPFPSTPPLPSSGPGILQYAVTVIMDAQGAWAWSGWNLRWTWMDLLKCTLPGRSEAWFQVPVRRAAA